MWQLVFSLILISHIAEAAFENNRLSVRAEGMGGAFTSIADDTGAIFYNPAGLAQGTLTEITCLHTHPFDISELEQNIITYFQVAKRHGIGFSYLQFTASDSYKETQLLFGAGTFVGKNLCLGTNFKQLKFSIAGYNNVSKFEIDVGGLYKISPKITIGIVGFNLNHVSDVEKNYAVGLSISPMPTLLIAIDLARSERFSEIKLGQEIWLTKNLCLRAGIKKHTITQPTLGLGMLRDHSHLDYSCIFHPTLDKTHLFSLTRRF